jgi:signal peptidase I
MNKPSSDTKTDVSHAISTEHAQRDILKAIFYCLLVVVFIRSFIVEPFRIPSSSMVPTLRIGDHIFVSKFSYGLSIPFTKFEFFSFSKPKRGDVVVFLWPRDESLHYVKRIVGLPGDKVEIKDKNIWINDKAVAKESLSADQLKDTISEKHATIEANELCKANIIPFQFRQLLYTLISNALKFSNPEKKSHIIITSKIESF